LLVILLCQNKVLYEQYFILSLVCIKYAFGMDEICQFILLFSLFLLLFMSLIVLFSTIYESHCTILSNFYLYIQYFQ